MINDLRTIMRFVTGDEGDEAEWEQMRNLPADSPMSAFTNKVRRVAGKASATVDLIQANREAQRQKRMGSAQAASSASSIAAAAPVPAPAAAGTTSNNNVTAMQLAQEAQAPASAPAPAATQACPSWDSCCPARRPCQAWVCPMPPWASSRSSRA